MILRQICENFYVGEGYSFMLERRTDIVREISYVTAKELEQFKSHVEITFLSIGGLSGETSCFSLSACNRILGEFCKTIIIPIIRFSNNYESTYLIILLKLIITPN